MASTFTPASYNGDKPNGWIDNWISQGQMFGAYGGGNRYIQETLEGYKGGIYGSTSADDTPWAVDPSNTAAIDALVTYALSGNVNDNRYKILGRDELIDNGKGPWKVSRDAATDFVPVYVVYTNDISTSEDPFSLAIDMLPSTGGTTSGLPIATNILINTAITTGAFLGARIKASMDARGITSAQNDPSQSSFDSKILSRNKFQNFVNGDILITPDGFSSLTKNYSASATGKISGSATITTVTSLSRQGDGSWQMVDTRGVTYFWPKIVNGQTVQPLREDNNQPIDSITPDVLISEGRASINIKPAYLDSGSGTYKAFPDLTIDKNFNFKQQLADALSYLKTNQASLEQLGVVFPDNFAAIAANPGAAFSPRPGVNLPALEFSGNADDYLASQAWLAKLFAGPLNVATVLNLWRGSYGTTTINQSWGGNNGSMRDDSGELTGLTTAQQVRDNLDKIADAYYNSAKAMGWFKAAPYMDYISIDKYELDELSAKNQGANGGMYNRNGWINYLYFTQALAQRLPTGVDANYDPITKTTSGNISTQLFQMPTASTVVANPDGTANATYYSSAGWGGAEYEPHLSSAFDSFFGNPALTSEAAINNNFREWVDPSYEGTDFQERGPNSQTPLAEYLFSQKANALENAGDQKDWTKGLLTPGNDRSGPSIHGVFNHIFSILWGGGNTSAPINYSPSGWLAAGQPADPSNTSNGYVKNAWNTAVLDNVLQKLGGWAKSNQLLNGRSYSGEVVPQSTALVNAALKVAGTSGHQSVSLRLVDQGTFTVQWGLFLLDATAPVVGDPITGMVGGVAPGSSGYAEAVRKAVSDPLTGSGWITDAGMGSHVDKTLTLQAGRSYGIAMLVPTQQGGAADTLLTSLAAANPFGKAHGALLPTDQLMTNLKLTIPGGITSKTQTLGFEDAINGPDWDYNDASFTVLSGATLQL